MEREWVLGPQGEYLVVAGRRGLVTNATETPRAARREIFFWGWTKPLGRAALQLSGRLLVRWRDYDWAWDTPTEAEARALVPHVVELLRTGAWVPVRMPQPELPGARVTDVGDDVFG